MIIQKQLRRLLASSLAAASLLPVASLAPLGVTATVAVVEIAAPATAEAKPKWQAFVGNRNGTRRPVRAKSLKNLERKVERKSGQFATEYVQNMDSGEWRPAPYKGKPAQDQFGNNLLQIR
jgi:hypothetical protein